MAELYYTPAQQNYKEANLPDNISKMIALVEPMRRQAMYNEARMDQAIEKFGQFTSPLQNDVEDYYAMLDRSGMKQLVNDMANNPNMLRTPEFQQRFNQMKGAIDYNFIANAEASKEAALNELKTYGAYQQKGVFNPNIHQINYAHRTSAPSQEGGGIYQDRRIAPWISPDEYAREYFKNVQPEPTGDLIEDEYGYAKALFDNTRGLNETAANMIAMADPATLRNWTLDYEARARQGGSKFNTPSEDIQSQINSAMAPFVKRESKYMPMREADGSLSRSGSGGSGSLTDPSNIIPLADALMIGSSTAEKQALGEKMMGRLTDEEFDRMNELLIKNNAGQLGIINGVNPTVSDAIEALGKIQVSDQSGNIVNSEPIEEMKRVLGRIKNEIRPGDTGVRVTPDYFNTMFQVRNPEAPVSVQFHNSDENGDKNKEYFVSRLKPSDVKISNRDGGYLDLDNNAVMSAISPDYNAIVPSGSESTTKGWRGKYSGPASAYSSFLEDKAEKAASYEDAESKISSGKYKWKNKELSNEFKLYNDANRNLGKDFMKFLSNELFRGDVMTTMTTSQHNIDDNGRNIPVMTGSSALIQEDKLKKVTEDFAKYLANAGYPGIGKLISNNPDKLIGMFFQGEKGDIKTDSKEKAPIFSVGKKVNIDADNSGIISNKGTTSVPALRGRYYTVNFNYAIPPESNIMQNYATNKEGFQAAGTAAQNLQLEKEILSLIGRYNADARRMEEEDIYNQIYE